MIHTGDAIEVMAGMEAESVDAVVTDPPYGLEFMGRTWDRLGDVGTTSHAGVTSSSGSRDRTLNAAYGRLGKVAYNGSANRKCRKCKRWAWDHEGRKCVCEVPDFPNVEGHQARLMQEWHYGWAVEALRVTKPGGYLLAFGGTRTHHRLVCGLEDAGWIIRDELTWIYASGFPKGRANLKPAHEPIVLARKPGPLRPLGIDAGRIPGAVPQTVHGVSSRQGEVYGHFREEPEPSIVNEGGRWPSNLLLSDPELFDEPNPEVVGSGATSVSGAAGVKGSSGFAEGYDGEYDVPYGDSGGYSRFFAIPRHTKPDPSSGDTFYEIEDGKLGREIPADQVEIVETGDPEHPVAFIIPKSSRSDREPVVTPDGHDRTKRFSTHPTQKPTDLMAHLIRLVCPPDGVILDPFLGSGSTAVAAEREGVKWIGIEKEPEYVAIAEARLNGTQRGLGLDVGAPTSTYRPPTKMPPPRFKESGTPKGWTGGWADDPKEEPAA